jgi:hypothetical protein
VIELESTIRRQLLALVPLSEGTRPDWRDVLERADLDTPRRRVPRVLAAAAVLLVGILCAVPAIALRGHIFRLFRDAPRAPDRIERSFATFERGVPPRLRYGVRATEARKVLETAVGEGATAIVWVAPRTRGGFCTLTEIDLADGERDGAGGECTPLLNELSVETSLHGRVSTTGEILSGPVLIDGWIGLSKASSLEVEFEDGATAFLPLVWVSEPVDTGFFAYAVPPLHWQLGHLPTRLVARDADGDEIAHKPISGIDLRGAYGQN